MNDLAIFQFEQNEVRFVGTPEKLEWVASDVVSVLYPEADKRNHSNYLKKVPSKWKGHKKIMTLGGEQEFATLFEPGFFCLLGRSSSPIAVAFQDWLYEEVVPSIRKTGSYAIAQTTIQPQKALAPEKPSLQELSDFHDLTIGKAGVDPRLVAGLKIESMIRYYPALTEAGEISKSTLSIPAESNLVRPTVLALKLSQTTGESWSAVRVNKVLIEQGFQIKNPDGKNPDYLPTEKGREHGQIVFDTAKGHGKTIQSLQWHLSVLEALEANDH